MKRSLSLVLSILLVLSVFSTGFVSLSTSAETVPTVADNYGELCDYINKYGEVDEENDFKYLLFVDEQETTISEYILQLKDGQITMSMGFAVYYEKSDETYVQVTNMMFFPASDYLYVDQTIRLYYGEEIYDLATKSGAISKSQYKADATYPLYASGTTGYITSEDFSEMFNLAIDIICSLWDNYIYEELGFGLKGLGFHSYAGCGEDACDPDLSYHLDAEEVRNDKEAGCLTDGYTGDTYCGHCGEKLETGKVIPNHGGHEYDNDCDKYCNRCNEEREADHIFGDYDICIKCGAKPFAAGDLTNDGKINSLDGLMLMRYLNGWNVDVKAPEAMDVNGDGKVNSLDGLMLMRYLNGWNINLG